MARGLSLTHQNAWRLAVVFILFELFAAVAVVTLLMLPMARRAAGDLAALMVLSAQTWSELPPLTRPAFVRELAASHHLFITTEPPSGTPIEVLHPPYITQLADSLSDRIGRPVEIHDLERNGEHWHWTALPSGGGTLWVSLPHGRVGSQPLAAALLTLAFALVLALAAAWWLARRTVAPLRELDAAAATLGRGEAPARLAETGPREVAALARRFNELAHQVHDLLEARTTLLAGLSHDLRTPLARMRLALEMQQRRPDPAWIERLDSDIGEMDRLIGELLDLARGLGREAAMPVDLAVLLQELAEHAREAGAEVAVSASPVQGEYPIASLRRVLGNLLGNALRYGGGQIELHLESGAGGPRIGILDRGPGIPADQLEAVFRPFHRVESSRSTATGGSGLGLAIVRQLCQANGWRIALENRAGGGLAAQVDLSDSRPAA
ncbi:MAG: HAMP domain-containing protein [Thiobacillus sp.]|nr:HAMP domain-containing protein [Thiobacillus sp.]